MTNERIRKPITLPTGRIGYPKLNPTNPPLQGLENKRKRWSLDIYLEPDSDGTQRLKDTLAEAVNAFEELHGYEPAKSPKLKRMTEWANKTKTRKTDPSLVGKLKIEAGANAEKADGGLHTPPALVDADKEPIPHTDIYPGCYARVVVLLDEYMKKNEKGAIITHGLSFTLKMVQFVRDGERMGGDTTDYSQFLDEDLEEEAPAQRGPAVKGPFKGAVKRNAVEVSDDDI